jgi:hypothetical protein
MDRGFDPQGWAGPDILDRQFDVALIAYPGLVVIRHIDHRYDNWSMSFFHLVTGES